MYSFHWASQTVTAEYAAVLASQNLALTWQQLVVMQDIWQVLDIFHSFQTIFKWHQQLQICKPIHILLIYAKWLLHIMIGKFKHLKFLTKNNMIKYNSDVFFTDCFSFCNEETLMYGQKCFPSASSATF